MSPRFVSIADQGFNSLSNFALVAFVAMTSSPNEFGEFSIAYAFFVFVLGAQRALVGETALVYESLEVTQREGRGRVLPGASLLVAVPGAVLLFAIGAFVPSAGRPLWWALAAAVLVALLQDGFRFTALVDHRPAEALILDLIWTIPSLAAMSVLVLIDGDPYLIVSAWAAGALLSAIWGAIRSRALPSPREGLRWLRRHRKAAARYFAEFASLNGSTLAVWTLLAPIIGVAGVGALRGAQLLFSPVNTVFTAVRVAMIPELKRVRTTGVYRRRLLELAVILIGCAAAWGLLVLVLNDDLGGLLLGATWTGAEELRLPYFVQYLLMAGYTLVLTVFRVDKLNAASSWMRGTLAGLTLALPLVLGASFGVVGAAWGFASAVVVTAVVGLFLWRRAGRARA